MKKIICAVIVLSCLSLPGKSTVLQTTDPLAGIENQLAFAVESLKTGNISGFLISGGWGSGALTILSAGSAALLGQEGARVISSQAVRTTVRYSWKIARVSLGGIVIGVMINFFNTNPASANYYLSPRGFVDFLKLPAPDIYQYAKNNPSLRALVIALARMQNQKKKPQLKFATDVPGSITQ